MKTITYLLPFAFPFLLACNSEQRSGSIADSTAFNSITETGLAKYVQELSDDHFEGRKPFTDGEQKTIDYLQKAFEEVGLKSGNGESFF